MAGAFLTKKYVLVFLLVFFALAITTYALAEQAYLTTTPTVANQTQQQINNLRENITPQSIFFNNLLVSVLAIVPIAGIILFGRVWINTGQTIGQLAYSYGVSPLAYVIGVYIPVGILETSAYSVLIAESIFLTYALKQGTFVERLKNQTWKSFLLYLALLAIAATVEAAMINGHI